MKNRELRKSVLIPARMRIGGAWVDVRIRNVSTRGMMLETQSVPDRGTYLEIARARLSITGRVAWSRNGQCGIQTRDDIDLSGLSGEPAAAKPASPGAPPRSPSVRPARIQDRRDRSRAFGRMMEFAMVVACAAGGVTVLSETAYAQLSGTLEVVQAKL